MRPERRLPGPDHARGRTLVPGLRPRNKTDMGWQDRDTSQGFGGQRPPSSTKHSFRLVCARPKEWLFPGWRIGHHISSTSVPVACREAVARNENECTPYPLTSKVPASRRHIWQGIATAQSHFRRNTAKKRGPCKLLKTAREFAIPSKGHPHVFARGQR
jgi:hypothetical protein